MMYILKFILLWLLPPGCMVLLLAALTFYLSSGKILISPFSFVPQAYALDLTAMALKEYLALAAGNFL